MRTIFSALLLALLAGCRGSDPKSGWEYRTAHGAYSASLFYRFADGEGTTLIGSCNGEPSFMVDGGAWDGPEFSLTVDGKSWRFPTRQGEHGHYLEVEGQEANDAIAKATREISFQVGGWRRGMRPAGPLMKFVAGCS